MALPTGISFSADLKVDLPARFNVAVPFIDRHRDEGLAHVAREAGRPVAYLLDGEEAVFCTAGGGKLAAATLNHVVAFEVDEIDVANRTGWSVLGVGEAYEVTDPPRLADLAAHMPHPWTAIRDGHTVAIPS